jgi:hypothetical protein
LLFFSCNFNLNKIKSKYIWLVLLKRRKNKDKYDEIVLDYNKCEKDILDADKKIVDVLKNKILNDGKVVINHVHIHNYSHDSVKKKKGFSKKVKGLFVAGLVVLGFMGYNYVSHKSVMPKSYEVGKAYLSGNILHGGFNDKHKVVSSTDLVCEPDLFASDLIRVSGSAYILDSKIYLKSNDCVDLENKDIELVFDHNELDWDKVLADVSDDPTLTFYGDVFSNDKGYYVLVRDYEDSRKTFRKDWNFFKSRFRGVVSTSSNSAHQSVNEYEEVIDSVPNQIKDIGDNVVDTGEQVKGVTKNINEVVSVLNEGINETINYNIKD